MDMTSQEYADYVGSAGKTIGEQKAEQAIQTRGDSTEILINEKTTVGNIPAVHVRYSFDHETAGRLYRDEYSLLYHGILYEISLQWSEKTANSTLQAIEKAVGSITFR